MRNIISIAKKELIQIARDPRSLIIIFVLPVFLLVIFGYAISLDVKNITLGIYDIDNSVRSRDFIRVFEGSSYFKITEYIHGESEINSLIENGDVKCVVVIPRNFSKDIENHQNVKVQFLIDGVDGSTASIVQNYVNAAAAFQSLKISSEFIESKGMKVVQPLNVDAQFWYNKDLNTTKFFIPGLIAMILIIISVILTSISLVREKELGTIEQIKVSSVSSFQLIIGKIFPYLIISLLIAASILFMGSILFGIEVKGSYLYLFIGTICYLMVTLSMGVLISTVADSQQVAFQMSQLVSQLPTVLLSGFLFPIESMPAAIQVLSYITPAKYYLVILRDILIKGVDISVFADQIFYLLMFAALLISISVLRIKHTEKI